MNQPPLSDDQKPDEQPNPSPVPALSPESEPPATPPMIWIGSLTDYNNGILHGQWIDATQDEADLHHAIQRILRDSPTAARYGEPAEEYAIFDVDSFHGLPIGEYEDIGTIAKLAHLIARRGEPFAKWAKDVGRDTACSDTAEDQFLDAHQGTYDNREDYAAELIEDMGLETAIDKAVDPPLRSYVQVDYAMLACDLELGGDVSYVRADDGRWFVFRW